MSRSLYPVFLKLTGRRVLVVGGGVIAEQKVQALLRSCDDLTVIAPEVTAQIASWSAEGRLRHVRGEYQPGMAQGHFLVISCTDSNEANRAVYQEAREAGALVNAVDDPPFCDFYAPAVVTRGDFQIAISTAGHSPALAQRLRKQMEHEFGPEYESWTAWLGRMRTAIRQAVPPSEGRKQLLHLLPLCRPNKGVGA